MTDPADATVEILSYVRRDEICTVVAVTERVSAVTAVELLRLNKVRCRILGRGKGRICRAGRPEEACDLLVLAIERSDYRRSGLYLDLFGLTSIPYPSAARSTSL